MKCKETGEVLRVQICYTAHMKSNTLIGCILLILLLIAGWFAYTHRPPATTSVSNADDMAVRAIVEAFGTKLQMVSLLAPMSDRKAAMDAAYASYVAPELLAQWYPEGAEALGRQASSPWPERIEIVEVRPEGAAYVVEGNVIEVTSVEAGAQKAAAAIYPVTLTLEKRGTTQWLITKATKGAYSEIPHSQTITGVWECLPHKDTSGPQTTECAFGIAKDQSDGHFAVDTRLMSTYPVDYAVGTHVRATGIVTPANQLSSIQKYDIDGILSATVIEKI